MNRFVMAIFASILFCSVCHSEEGIIEYAKNGNLKAVKDAITTNPQAIFKSDHNGNTPLLWAILNGHNEVALQILDAGYPVDGNTRCPFPPILACTSRYTEDSTDMLKELLIRSADPNIYYEKEGWRALTMAVNNGMVDKVSLLILNGADPTLKNGHGQTAMDVAKHYLALANDPNFDLPHGELQDPEKRKEMKLKWQRMVSTLKKLSSIPAPKIQIRKEGEGLYLDYDCPFSFTLSIFSESDRKVSSTVINAGKGTLNAFIDKGAIWLTEDGKGTALYTPATPASLAEKPETLSKNHVFKIGSIAQDGHLAPVLLTVVVNDGLKYAEAFAAAVALTERWHVIRESHLMHSISLLHSSDPGMIPYLVALSKRQKYQQGGWPFWAILTGCLADIGGQAGISTLRSIAEDEQAYKPAREYAEKAVNGNWPARAPSSEIVEKLQGTHIAFPWDTYPEFGKFKEVDSMRIRFREDSGEVNIKYTDTTSLSIDVEVVNQEGFPTLRYRFPNKSSSALAEDKWSPPYKLRLIEDDVLIFYAGAWVKIAHMDNAK